MTQDESKNKKILQAVKNEMPWVKIMQKYHTNPAGIRRAMGQPLKYKKRRKHHSKKAETPSLELQQAPIRDWLLRFADGQTIITSNEKEALDEYKNGMLSGRAPYLCRLSKVDVDFEAKVHERASKEG